MRRKYYDISDAEYHDDFAYVFGGLIKIYKSGAVYKYDKWTEDYEFKRCRIRSGRLVFDFFSGGVRGSILVGKLILQLWGPKEWRRDFYHLDGDYNNFDLKNLKWGSTNTKKAINRVNVKYPKTVMYKGDKYYHVPGGYGLYIARDGRVYDYFMRKTKRCLKLGNLMKVEIVTGPKQKASVYTNQLQYAVKYRVDLLKVDAALIQYKDNDVANVSYYNIYSSYFSYNLSPAWMDHNTVVVLGSVKINRKGEWWRLSRGKWVKGVGLVRGKAIAAKGNKQINYKKLMKELYE